MDSVPAVYNIRFCFDFLEQQQHHLAGVPDFSHTGKL